MNNESENRVQDPRVTETYRALANERTPDHLTRQILKLAADDRTPYARARAWMRPAAWAATVGLSLAIVLELTQLPSGPDYVSIAPATDSDTLENRVTRYDDAAEATRSDVAGMQAPLSSKQMDIADEASRKRAMELPPPSPEMPSTEEYAPRAEQVMQEAEALAKARAGSDTGPVAAPAAADAPAATDAPAAAARLTGQMSTDRGATNRLAAKQISPEARSAAGSFATTGAAAESDPGCPASERETADAWLACIRQLRESGRDELADEEYKRFRQVYPEFDDSVTDK